MTWCTAICAQTQDFPPAPAGAGLRRERTRPGAGIGGLSWARNRCPRLEAHAELLAITGIPPQADPDPAVFLYGHVPVRPEIQLCWRREFDDLAPEYWPEAIAQFPPSPPEFLTLPLATFRAWCHNLPDEELSDLPICRSLWRPADPLPGSGEVLRYVPDEADDDRGAEVVSLEARPARRPARFCPAGGGGCDRFGWNPKVRDVEDAAEGVRGDGFPYGGAPVAPGG